MPTSRLNESAEIDLRQSKILIVDDQPINIQTLYSILTDDYVVLAATSGEDALLVCKENPPDLILLDVVMPEMTGLELCQRLKAESNTRDIPVIFVTSFNQQDEEDECWRSGGIDFITKPVNPMTVKNRVKAHLTLKIQKDMLLKLVYVDGLTGVFNRRYFDTHLEKLSNESIRSQRDSALIMVDIDFFKLFNDNYGHIAGDETLRQVAKIIKNALTRPSDFVSRYGGEEFVVVLPDTNKQGAERVAERIRKAVFEQSMEHMLSPHAVITVSLGVATYFQSQKNKRSLIKEADMHLYEAKSAGRNTVFS